MYFNTIEVVIGGLTDKQYYTFTDCEVTSLEGLERWHCLSFTTQRNYVVKSGHYQRGQGIRLEDNGKLSFTGHSKSPTRLSITAVGNTYNVLVITELWREN